MLCDIERPQKKPKGPLTNSWPVFQLEQWHGSLGKIPEVLRTISRAAPSRMIFAYLDFDPREMYLQIVLKSEATGAHPPVTVAHYRSRTWYLAVLAAVEIVGFQGQTGPTTGFEYSNWTDCWIYSNRLSNRQLTNSLAVLIVKYRFFRQSRPARLLLSMIS